MPTVEQCRTYAAEYKMLGKDKNISARRSSVLSNIFPKLGGSGSSA